MSVQEIGEQDARESLSMHPLWEEVSHPASQFSLDTTLTGPRS
jgi:hypothetical protein